MRVDDPLGLKQAHNNKSYKERLVMRNKIVIAIVMFCMLLATSAFAATSARVLDAEVDDTLDTFRKTVSNADDILGKAKAVLIFPSVIKAGIAFGGEYGEGALRIGGRSVEYYSTVAGSFGFQLGVQKKSLIIIFLESNALENFRNSSGWKAGVDGSIALVKVGVGGTLDTDNIKEPIISFVLGQKGLMYNLTLEGSKFNKLLVSK